MTTQQARRLTRLRERARRQRGVVLLIVVSLLVLFVLLGVTYAVIASRYKDTATASKRLEFYRDKPQSELDRVFYDLLREPNYQFSGVSQITAPGFSYDPAHASTAGGIGNPSALAGHSILRDLYGINGSGFGDVVTFTESGVVYPQMAAAQNFIRFHFNNSTTLLGDVASPSDVPNAYTGCWIHFTSGAFAGESARIRGYDPARVDPGAGNILPALLIDATSYSGRNLYALDATNTVEFMTNLVGSRFLLSGKPFGGRGHGWQPGNYSVQTPTSAPTWGLSYYNVASAPIPPNVQDPIGQFANIHQTDPWSRSADSVIFGGMFPPNTSSPAEIREARKHLENLVALMPHFSKYENAARSMPGFIDYTQPYTPDPSVRSVALRNLERDAGPNPYAVPEDPLSLIGQIPPTDATNIPPTFAPLDPNRGDANEPWDAYDYQNPWLSMLMPITYDANNNPTAFYAGPSFHQGPLINYWFNRMITPVLDAGGAPNPALSGPLSSIPTRSLQVAAFLFPYGPNGILDADDAPTFWQGMTPPADWAIRLRYVESVTRRVFFRPSPAMNPSFTGSNPFSLVRGGMPFSETPQTGVLPSDNSLFKLLTTTNVANVGFANQVISDVINSFDAAAPGLPRNGFDVDNDNDSIRDSVWIDPGLPIVTMPDGRRYKRLVAVMVKDLDNRLNINAIGNTAQVVSAPGAPVGTVLTSNVAAGAFPSVANPFGNVALPRGIGFGPADIDASSLFAGTTTTLSRILLARYESVLEPNPGVNLFIAQPGLPGITTTLVNDYEAMRKLIGPITPGNSTPLNPYNFMGMGQTPSQAGYTLTGGTIQITTPAFIGPAVASPIDIWGRGTLYLDKSGNPIFYNFGANSGLTDLVSSPYEMNPFGNKSSSDTVFNLTDLERLLRSTDLDVASVSTRATIALNGEGNNRRVRDALTTLSSHIPALNFAAPTWQKKSWTQASSANIASAYTTYPAITPRLQRLLSTASVVELAKARLPMATYLDTSVNPAQNRPRFDANGYPLATPVGRIPMAYGPNPNYFGTPADNVFVAHPDGSGRFLGTEGATPWQPRIPVADYQNPTPVEQEGMSLSGWDPGLRFEHISYDDQLRRMLPWEILHGEKLNLNRYLEDEAPTYFGTRSVSTVTAPYVNQNDVPDIRGYNRANRTNVFGINSSTVYLSQRQLLARHLYCMMSLVIDPNVADWMFQDEINFRTQRFAQGTAASGFGGMSQARWAARELLARTIAQWAVNAVDMMDQDGVMTPFEYDVNPWNGWSVDGILGTEDDYDRVSFPDRRLVWGTEPADILITETVNLHNKQIMDHPKNGFRIDATNTMTMQRDDSDLDQVAPPQGSTFIEIFCPRSVTASNALVSGEVIKSHPTYATLPEELYTNGLLDLSKTVVDGNVSYPVWRIAISEDIRENEDESDYDYIPERNMWRAYGRQDTIAQGNTMFRQSFVFEPSYDIDSSSGLNIPGRVEFEYVALSPFVGNVDIANQASTAFKPSSRVVDGYGAATSQLTMRSGDGYQQYYVPDLIRTQRCRTRLALERYIYFTDAAPDVWERGIPNSGDPLYQDRSRSFARWGAGNVLLSPQQYAVVGPRAVTHMGAMNGANADSGNKYTNNLFDTGLGINGWSRHRIELGPSVATYALDPVTAGGEIATTPPPVGPAGAPPINFPLGVVVTRPSISSTYNGGQWNVGASISEPLEIRDPADRTTVQTNYYPNVPAAGAGRPLGFYGAVAPPDMADEADIPNHPLDYRIQTGTSSPNHTPISMSEKVTTAGGDIPRLARSGTHDNRRIAFAQRLADPRVRWHRDANPYITIDFSTMDLTVFSGLENTRRTTNGNPATSENQQDADGQYLATDAMDHDDNPMTAPIPVDDPFGDDFVNNTQGAASVRSQFITRERGYRDYNVSAEAAYADAFPYQGYAGLNMWSPLTIPTRNADGLGNPRLQTTQGERTVYMNGLNFGNGAVYTGPGEFSNADPLTARSVPPFGFAGDWRRPIATPGGDKNNQLTNTDEVLDFNAYQTGVNGMTPIYLKGLSNTLGYLNRSLGRRPFSAPAADNFPGASDRPPPWNGFHERMLANPMELLTVPASPASRWGADFIIQPLDHSPTANNATRSAYSANGRQLTANAPYPYGIRGMYPSLLNMLWSSADSEYVDGPNGTIVYQPQYDPAGNPLYVNVGASQKRTDFARIFDLIDTPSRFNGTTDYFNEVDPSSYASGDAFNVAQNASQPNINMLVGVPGQTNNGVTQQWLGFESYRFPYNYASKLREPGKINLNTLYDRNVFRALVGDNSAAASTQNGVDGWSRFLFTRRGIPLGAAGNNTDANTYGTDPVLNNIPFGIQAMLPNVAFPSLMNNPFRPASSADVMPAPVYVDRTATTSNLRHNLSMRNQSPVDATLLRRDLTSSTTNEQPLFDFQVNADGSTNLGRAEPVDPAFNPYFRFQGQEQLANSVSGTSNVFAIWITIGYFEVEPNYVNREPTVARGNVADPYTIGANTQLPGGFVTVAQITQAAANMGMTTAQYLTQFSDASLGGNFIHIEYDVNHPDGTRLGAELGSDDATFARHRAFYIVDRSIPVAFEPGKTHNTERCVLLKRFIE
jgi:hypothetical protein